jgi:hypothetical protein
MTATATRWPGHCNACGAGGEVESRPDHAMRALCDRCATTAPRATSASGTSSRHLVAVPDVPVVPDTCLLTPGATRSVEDAEVEQLLALHAAGELEPVEVAFRPIRRSAAPVVHAVATDFALVHGLRLWAGDERAVPYGSAWAAERLRRPQTTIRRALRELAPADRSGVLTFEGEMPARGMGNGTRCYLPAVIA